MDSKTILIVDDDRAIRKLLERVAQRAGFETDCAKDGFEALEMLQAKRYAIAIVDLMMPRISGYELLQKISELEHRPTILVATAMANGDVATLDDSLVRRVIRKPFDIEALAKVLTETARQIDAHEEPIRIVPPASSAISVVNVGADESQAAPVEEKPGETKPAIEEPPKT